MNKRVLDIIETKKLTPSRFADKIGVPRSTISHIISGRNKPSLELVSKIANTFPEINLDWLIKGKGSIISLQTSLFDTKETQFHKEDIEKTTKQEDNTTAQDSSQMETVQIDAEKHEKKEDSDIYKQKSNDKQTKDQPDITETAKQREEISKIIIVYKDNSFEIMHPRS